MDYRGFTDGSYTSQSILADAELTMNWYPEPIESDNGKVRLALYPTPGFSPFITVTGQTGAAALFSMNGVTLGVIGSTLWRIDTVAQTATNVGTVARDSVPAYITMNGVGTNQAFVGSGQNGYILNATTNAFTVIGGLIGKTQQVGMLDGFFIAFDPTTGRMYLSNNADGLTWDPTQFAQRSAAADSWRAMIVVPPDVWLIGQRSGDVWYDAGNFPFPLAPRQGLTYKYGIIAPHSLAAIGSSVFWISQNELGAGIVVRTVGYQPQRISTFAVENALMRYTRDSRISDAEALVYQGQGHEYYVLSFPTANATWCYDATVNKWHQRGYWNVPANQFDIWKPRVACSVEGQRLTGDRTSATIAKMDIAYGTELDGSAIRRVRRTPGMFSQLRQLPIRVLEVYLENGLGLQSGQGSDPIVMWRSSNDGGRTWGNERRGQSGRVGQYRTRVRFWRMGLPRDRVDECSVSDPIPWRVLSVFLNNDTAQ